MAEANKEINVKLERMNQRQLVEAYEPVITELLNSTMLLPEMACIFDDETRQQILCVNDANGKIKAATLFINFLVQSENPGWYTKFIDALKAKSYVYLAKCLESQDTEMQQSVFRRVMRKCFKYMTLIDPRPLLPELLAKECITAEEVDEISTAADRLPIRNVNFILLDAVVSHREEWFDIFLEVLRNGGYGSVADIIEEGLAQEFNQIEGDKILKRVIAHEVSIVSEDDEVPVNEEPAQPTTEPRMNEAANEVPPDDDNIMTGQLRLRPYQVQQAELAKQGHNVIIIAPTGSGKTYVAMGIVHNHFKMVECEEKPKVLFIVPTVPLVTQQYKLFKANFKKEVNKLSGDDTRLSMVTDDTFLKSEILVLTPQILTNALASGKIKSIKLFTMIILDECHHTNKDHPYATMMKHYLQEKQKSPTGLPQIVGLTASVGLDNSNTREKAVDHILRLLAHLDVQKISMSDVGPDISNTVTEEAEETSDRSHDPFKDKIIETMIKIEERMFSTSGFGKSSPPQDRVSQTYGNNWLASLKIDEIGDASIRGVLVACTKHLKVYYSALVLGSWCMAIDALENISKELTTICAAPKTELDYWLLKLFEDMEPILRDHCENDKNPKLESMKMKILAHTEEISAPPRVIVFCMTRELTRAVCRWISRDPDLALFNPDIIVGVNKAVASDDRAGMTQTEQNEVLKKFDQGVCKILVATSVAQEGIDIKACDYVINYGYITSDVGRVQSRGRVRAEVGKYTAIGAEGGGTVRREENNKRRESLMNEMLEDIKDMPDAEFRSKMARHQKELLIGWRRLENLHKVQRQIPDDIKRQCRLECFECGKFACTFADIRTIKGMYHVVITNDFKQNMFTTLHQGEMYDLDIETTHKLYCGTCEEKCEWGIQILYKKMSFSVIKIKAFLIRDPKGKTKKYAKWAKFPLKATEITEEELDEYMEEF